MKRLRFILLICASIVYSLVVAQTPYDSFSPETSRPMLVMEDEVSMRQQHVETSSDSMRYAVIVDIQQQAVYLADLSEEQILAIAPLTDEMLSWLSVDPLSDKYPNISPYAYCAWNPIKFIDKDGLDLTLIGSNKSRIVIRTDIINLDVNVSQLHIDFGGNYTFEGEEILSAALDLAGIVDPFGIADGLNAALQLKNGDIGGAVISVVGLIPGFGDAAKVGKIRKDVRIINKATKAVKNGEKVKRNSLVNISGKSEAEHTKNARPSTKNKHQEGQTRKMHDKHGEKGDARRKRYK